jgi:hypothetical protein
MMNGKINNQPKLIDSEVYRDLFNSLETKKPDYWTPSKTVMIDFFNRSVKPNILIIIFFIILIIYLIYRYRKTVIKKRLERVNRLKNNNVDDWKPDQATLDAISDEIRQRDRYDRELMHDLAIEDDVRERNHRSEVKQKRR